MPEPILDIPREFEEYRLLRPLGRGQMGQVYLAHDTLLDRTVAIKFLASLQPDEGMRRRFFTEARAIARLQHPNVVSIYRVAEVRGCPYLVSEFVRGQPLDSLPRPVPWAKVVEIGIGLCRGLAAAHRQGVLHRDIKPANAILATTGEVKLLDFGLAKLLDADENAEARMDVRAPLAANETIAAPDAPARAATTEFERTTQRGASQDGTAAGLLGTPLFLAPERWAGEPATRQSDLYAVGVLLYELVAGQPPYLGEDLSTLQERVFAGPPQALAGLVADIPPRLAAVIHACLEHDATCRPRSADDLLLGLQALTGPIVAAPMPAVSPYRGLVPFEADHRGQFFGRQADLLALVERLTTQPFVLILGDSGVGKSSLCRAAVLPAMLGASLRPGDRPFRATTLVPGRTPVSALASALAPWLGREDAAIAWLISEEPMALAREVQRKSVESNARLLIFIDQLEELVTIAPARQAEATARALAALIERAPAVRLLATARSDLLTRLLGLPGLGDEAAGAIYPLRPLGPDGLREAIVRPARAAGYDFESESLVDALVASTERAPGGLPLLQFALSELWAARDEARQIIPAAALERLGGVEGALATHAERVIANLTAEEQSRAQAILTRLVTAEGTRARRPLGELVANPDDGAGNRAIEALVKGRLVVAGESSGRDGKAAGVYEIAHEALVKNWPRLGEWLADDGDLRAARERLDRAAADWLRLGKSREALLGTRGLAELVVLRTAELPPTSAEFLAASVHRRRRVRMARTALWLAGPLAIAAVVGGTMLRRQQRTQAEIERQVSAAQGLISEGRATAATALALRAPMEAAFDAGSVADGEAHWSRLRAGLAKADEALARSLATLDRAMPLSPGDPAIVGALQTALRERIGIAVAHHRPEEARALSARLEATAPIDGAPAPPPTATLKLGTEPPAEVVLERFATGAEVTWQLQESRRLGRTPVAALPLPAGSYVFALTAAGHAPVRRPLVVDPGDTTTRQLTLSLPKATDVPPGFIYIPPGEFRFGAATDETFRRGFLNTSPLRRLETHAYLIGRHEVTYGEYLPFLEALPAAERIRRTPGSAGNGFAGAVQLRPGPGAGGRPWQFSFVTIAGQRVTARAGDPFVLPGRPARASQDWARLPVSGISADDARAFAAWLAATKRVPGARLCNEIEWERAARGADGRIFPHGNVMESHDANFAHTYEGDRATSWKAPDEVGAHPASRSPFGLDDTAGNVWELVETAFGAKSHGPPGVSVRGGSYDQGLATLWLANRQVVDASYRDPTAGLRLCADVTPELR